MSYEVYDPCGGTIEDPVFDPCNTDVELGRVRGVAFVHTDFAAFLKADPTNATLWATGIATGVVKVIKETSGTYDGGQPVEVPGFGDSESQLIGFKFALAYKDPTLTENTPFYNSIMKSRSWHVAFRTETKTRLSDNPATIIPSNPVEEDMTSQAVWNVAVKFNQELHPVLFDTPAGVFKSF